MSAVWTLKNLRLGITDTLDGWRFQNPVITQTSQKTGELSVDRTLGSLDEELEFEYGDLCVLTRLPSATAVSGDVWFVGKCRPSGMESSYNSEGQGLLFTDPWFEMEATVYRKNTNASLASASGATGGFWSGHMALNLNSVGTGQTIATELNQILTYASTRVIADGVTGLPFQYDSGSLPDPVFGVWRDEVRNITIAEALRRQLRYLPGVSVFFDHSTGTDAVLPKPTLKMVMREDAPSATLQIAAGTGNSEGFKVERVWGQEVPCVVIQYEKTNTVNGKPYSYIVEDKYPASASSFEAFSLIQNIDLAGAARTTITQRLATRPFTAASGTPTDASRIAWWARHCPGYNDGAATGFGIVSVDNVALLQRSPSGTWVPASGAYLTPYANEITDGVWSSWMKYSTDGINYVESDCYEIGVSGAVKYKRKMPSGALVGEAQTAYLQGSVLVTQLSPGQAGQDYTTVSSNTPDEATPSGMAEWLYNQLKGPAYMGTVSFVQDEVDNFGGVLGMGKRLNLDVLNDDGTQNTGSDEYDMWRTMQATIQKIVHQLETGKTIVSFGPPKHLGATDIIELLRMQRVRTKWTNPQVLTGGDKSVDATNAGSKVFREVSHTGVSTKSNTTMLGATGATGTGFSHFAH